MNVFAIGDLHLPGGDNKPMDVFGAHWEGHFDKISASWTREVGQEDAVLIPGDISWAMRFENALEDLKMIGALPGHKLILRGNHDYWWGSVTRLREALPEKMYALQNDAVLLDGIAFCGTRGWTIPEGSAEDEKIYARELLRMEMSLKQAEALRPDRIIVMTHYPPLDEGGKATPMSELIESRQPECVVYGHLHGGSLRGAFNGIHGNVRYICVSCDGQDFEVKKITGQ